MVGKVVAMATAAETKQKERRHASRRLPLLGTFLISVATLLATATVALAVVFTNTTPINIPSAGSATPYPSQITVSGLTGTISDVNVNLRGLSHTWPEDVAVLLVGPGGQRAVLMSNAGGGDCINGSPVSNVNLTFDDQAAQLLPDGSQISSGTYRPIQGTTNADCGNSPVFPAPAPSGPYGTTLSAFNGTAPNGTYSLYVLDDTSPDGGSISGGWSLDLLAGGAPPPPPPPPPDATKPTVTAMSPRHKSITRDVTPSIRAVVRDNATNLQKANVKLYVNGKRITRFSYSAATDKLVYNSPKITKGKKTVRVVATDAAGNVRTTSWYFTIR